MQKLVAPRKLNQSQPKNFSVEISFLEGLVRRDPGYFDALRLLGLAYSRHGRHDLALPVFEQLVQLAPQDPRIFYNLACGYALNDQPERAITALGRALNRGYRDFKRVLRDPDLAKARKHPLFRLISDRMQRCWSGVV